MFVKWALELIKNNTEALSFAKLDSVVVNLPERFNHILERVNLEQQENKIAFHPFVVSKQNQTYKKHLKLFGGFYIKKYNTKNNF